MADNSNSLPLAFSQQIANSAAKCDLVKNKIFQLLDHCGGGSLGERAQACDAINQLYFDSVITSALALKTTIERPPPEVNTEHVASIILRAAGRGPFQQQQQQMMVPQPPAMIRPASVTGTSLEPINLDSEDEEVRRGANEVENGNDGGGNLPTSSSSDGVYLIPGENNDVVVTAVSSNDQRHSVSEESEESNDDDDEEEEEPVVTVAPMSMPKPKDPKPPVRSKVTVVQNNSPLVASTSAPAVASTPNRKRKPSSKDAGTSAKKRHQADDSSGASYPCLVPDCFRAFGSPGGLKMHSKTHSANSYHCTFKGCYYRSIYKHWAILHVKNHHLQKDKSNAENYILNLSLKS